MLLSLCFLGVMLLGLVAVLRGNTRREKRSLLLLHPNDTDCR